MVTVGMGDVNGDEVLAAFRDPVYQLLRMLHGQKGIDENSITFAVNERDGIGNPGETFLAGGQALGRAIALLGQQLPVQLRHKHSFSMLHFFAADDLLSEGIQMKALIFSETGEPKSVLKLTEIHTPP